MYGIPAAKQVFSRKLGININECTVRQFKKAYDEEVSRKRVSVGNYSPVKELHTKRRGRPVILGDNLLIIHKYVY